MSLKGWRICFFICQLIGVMPITLAAFNIGRDFISQYIFYFVAILWIGIIGNYIIKKVQQKKHRAF